jgi:uncharacterized protein YigE (DUF2233 family)
MVFQDGYKKILAALAITAGILFQPLPGLASGHAVGIGVVNPLPAGAIKNIHIGRSGRAFSKVQAGRLRKSGAAALKKARTAKGKSDAASGNSRGKKKGKDSASRTAKARKAAGPPRLPQEDIGSLSQETLVPGLVHKCHRGPLNINILDVDLSNPDLEVKPVLAGESLNVLDEVRDQAHKVNALAAVNANYFKKDGTPLGTLVLDGEWVAGPLYDRISFGLTDAGRCFVDRANLHGIIETSNPAVSKLWVNNINQPRRSGCRLIAYTRRWGAEVRMAYAGCLVSVDAGGRVLDKTTQRIGIPYGGFVLSDKKASEISKLQRGDLVSLEWHHRPESWADVVHAVSGGPALIKNGNLFLDLKGEKFRKTWTSSSIHARTALGVTRNRHLILATVEGPHTLWDMAKMLHKLGCVEAMNLDGGGSTTMVVHGNIVTRNKNTFQRRVAASLAVLPRSQALSPFRRRFSNYVPQTDLSLISEEEPAQSGFMQIRLADPAAGAAAERLLESAAPAQPTPLAGASGGSQAVPLVVEDSEDAAVKKKKAGRSISQALGDSLNKSLSLNKTISKSLGKSFGMGWMKGWLGK